MEKRGELLKWIQYYFLSEGLNGEHVEYIRTSLSLD
jgi:hypothetical protein